MDDKPKSVKWKNSSVFIKPWRAPMAKQGSRKKNEIALLQQLMPTNQWTE